MLQSSPQTAKNRKAQAKRAVGKTHLAIPLSPSVVDPAHTAALNAFYRRRPANTLTVGGERFALEVVWPPAIQPGRDARIGVMIGASGGALHLPRPLLERLLVSADPAVDLERLLPEHAALLLEAFLSDALSWLEKQLGGWIILDPDAKPKADAPIRFTFVLKNGEEAFPCTLELEDEAQAALLANLLDMTGDGTETLPDDFPVSANLYRSAVQLTYDELSSLRPGDVIIMTGAEAETAFLVVAETYAAPVTILDGSGYLTAGFRRFNESRWKWMMAERKAPDAGLALADADLDELPVTLVFELGRTALPIGELKRLGPGAVVPLEDVKNETVELVANGKRIGRGEIVRIGDSLGVRVLGIFGNA